MKNISFMFIIINKLSIFLTKNQLVILVVIFLRYVTKNLEHIVSPPISTKERKL